MKSWPKRKKSGAGRAKKAAQKLPLDPLRTGMPALDSITGLDVFGKGKKQLRIIHTSEMDTYDQPLSKARRKKT